VRRGGVHGVDQLRVRVRDPGNAIIRIIVAEPTYEIGQTFSLFNGLYAVLGPGSLVNGDTAVAQVFANIGSAVNPDSPFSGVRNADPNFQFGLPAISDGSFT
jgi:hypothetical protein